MLYPLKFKPLYKNYIWGGENLRKFGKVFPENEKVAESWELSSHPDGECIIANGIYEGRLLTDLIKEFGRELVGSALPQDKVEKFPLLIKLIDAADNLSVQVHPDDQYANIYENGELGKNEMWYVVDALPGAKLVYDLTKGTTKQDFIKAIEEGRISDCLNEVSVKPGDFFDIPAGLVHAIGKGIVIAEVQQNSNTTYRVYDYDRRDKDGNLRELHISKALETINFDSNKDEHITTSEKIVKLSPQTTLTNLVTNSYFSVDKIDLKDEITQSTYGERFHIFMVLEGEIKISSNNFEDITALKGETVLIPACCHDYSISGLATLIKALVP